MTDRIRGDRPERVRGDSKPDSNPNGNGESNGKDAKPPITRIPKYLADLNLTEKQFLFCIYYAETENGAKSARNAGYSPSGAGVIAHENLNKQNIREAIQRIRQSHINELEAIDAKMKVTTQNVLKHVASIAYFDPEWIYEEVEGIDLVTEGVWVDDDDESGKKHKEWRTYERKIHNPIRPISEWPEPARLALKKLEVNNDGKINKVEFYDKLEAERLLGSWLHDMFGRGKPTDDDDVEEAANKIQQMIRKISSSVPVGIRMKNALPAWMNEEKK